MARGRLSSQLAAALVMSMTPAVYSVTLSYVSLLLAESQLPRQQMTVAEATFVGSVVNLGRMLGCVVSSYLATRLGVIRLVKLVVLINITSWLLLTLGNKIMVLVGAPLVGLVPALTGLTGRMFIAEVTSNKYRSTLCNLPNLVMGVMGIVCYALSSLLPWRHALLVCGLTPSLVQIAGSLLLHESPRWLVSRGADLDRIEKAIIFYRGQQVDAMAETKSITASLQGKAKLSLPAQVRLIVSQWDVAKPCLLVLVQFFFHTFTGGVVLYQYAVSIFQDTVTGLQAAHCSMILAAIQTGALLIYSNLVSRSGRRPLLTWSAIVTALGCLIVALYYQFQTLLQSHTWLVLVGIILANCGSMGGIASISFLYCGELLSTSIRQMFCCVVSLCIGGFSAIFIYVFPMLQRVAGNQGLFFVLVGINVLQALYARFVLPETKGLSLEEVQFRYYSSRRKDRSGEDVRKTGVQGGNKKPEGNLKPEEKLTPEGKENLEVNHNTKGKENWIGYEKQEGSQKPEGTQNPAFVGDVEAGKEERDDLNV